MSMDDFEYKILRKDNKSLYLTLNKNMMVVAYSGMNEDEKNKFYADCFKHEYNRFEMYKFTPYLSYFKEEFISDDTAGFEL